MDQWEDLTELGHHLADLPVEPRLGKMVLYSIVLKCLDPVLTIVCALAYRDPCKYCIHQYLFVCRYFYISLAISLGFKFTVVSIKHNKIHKKFLNFNTI